MTEPKTNHEVELLNAVDRGFIAKTKALLKLSSIQLIIDERYFDYFLVIKALDNHHVALAKLLVENDFRVYKKSKTNRERTVFHAAIRSGDEELIRTLLDKGASPDILSFDEQNKTPLHLAVDEFQESIVQLFLSQFDSKTLDTYCILHYAVQQGNIHIVSQMIAKGLSLQKKNETKLTPLCIAVKHIKLKVVEFLLRKGADIVTNKNGSTPLHLAFEMKEKGFWETWQDFHDMNSIIDLILKANVALKANPKNKHGLSNFHIACSRDEPTAVKDFLKLGVSINQPVKVQCHLYKKFSPLHFAAKFRCKKTMQVLLKNGADVKQRDFQKMTALHIAAKESCLDVVSLLLQYGADLASKDSQGKTPLHRAFEKKNYAVIDLLLSDPNVAYSNPTNSEGVSHFHVACTRNNVNVVKSFIKNGVSLDKCVPAQSDEDNDSVVAVWSGYSPLHFAVSHNRAKIVQLLLDHGANVEIKNSKGLTPLHLACQYSRESFAEFIENTLCDLSKHKKITQQLQPLTDVAEVNEKYTKFSGMLPMYKNRSRQAFDWSASRKDYLKIMNLLLDYGSNVNCIDNKGNAPIFYAYAAVHKVKSKLQNNQICSQDLWAQIIESLFEELYERQILIINDLLKLDVNLEECYNHISILHYIPYVDDTRSDGITKLFLKHGANVEAKDENMLTPLLRATRRRRENLISILLDFGANVNCVDPKDKSTPLLIATSDYFDYKIFRMLLDKGANPNARQSNKRTALHNLVFYNLDNSVALSALIEAGADVNSRGGAEQTALHIARYFRDATLLKVLLMHGADVSIEDDAGRSVCCYSYEEYFGPWPDFRGNVIRLAALQEHVFKMIVIDLPVSAKVLSLISRFDALHPLPNGGKMKLIEKCQSEVQLLRNTPIHGGCTLLDVIFKKENALSHLVKCSTFQTIYTAQSESMEDPYPQYGYLIKLKYKAGVERGKLLPAAKLLLDKLAGPHLPDICFENICEYFNNVELKESIEILREALELKMESSDDGQMRGSRTSKRQKIN